MDIVLSLLADAANITNNGKLNLLGVFQSVCAKEVPVPLPLFYIVINLRADSHDKGTHHTYALQLKDADLRSVYETDDQPFSIPADTLMPFAEVGMIIAVHALIFPVFGHYQFHILIDGVQRREIDLLVQPIFVSHEERQE